jgi:hypothetical protein
MCVVIIHSPALDRAQRTSSQLSLKVPSIEVTRNARAWQTRSSLYPYASNRCLHYGHSGLSGTYKTYKTHPRASVRDARSGASPRRRSFRKRNAVSAPLTTNALTSAATDSSAVPRRQGKLVTDKARYLGDQRVCCSLEARYLQEKPAVLAGNSTSPPLGFARPHPARRGGGRGQTKGSPHPRRKRFLNLKPWISYRSAKVRAVAGDSLPRGCPRKRIARHAACQSDS